MNTIFYFVRHTESIYIEGVERTRGISQKGKIDSLRIKEVLANEDIDLLLSSPYARAIQTIEPLAEYLGKNIIVIDDLKERHIGDIPVSITFKEAKKKVYEDFNYFYPNGESSSQAQLRAVNALKSILNEYAGNRIVLGTHGDIMTLMINYFNNKYGFDFWQTTSMPDIYKLEFNDKALLNVKRMWR